MASNEQLQETVVALDSRLERLKKKSSEMAERTAALVFTVGGGLAAGYLDTEFKGKDLFGVPYSTVAGATATVVGLMGWAGNYSKPAEHFGSGVLACEAYKMLRNKMEKPTVAVSGQPQLTAAQLQDLWAGK